MGALFAATHAVFVVVVGIIHFTDLNIEDVERWLGEKYAARVSNGFIGFIVLVGLLDCVLFYFWSQSLGTQ